MSAEIWNGDGFLWELSRAALEYRSLPVSEFPNVIDLSGSWTQGHLSDVFNATFSDPSLRERGVYAKWNFDGNAEISEIQIGSTNSVNMHFVVKRGEDDKTGAEVYEKLLFRAHSHGIADDPPSPEDLSLLVTHPDELGIQAEIVLTESTTYLLIKSDQTPVYDSHEYAQRRMRTHACDLAILLAGMGGDSFRHQVSETLMQYFLQLCRVYHLVVYTAPAGDYRLQRVQI